jgi:type I restriction enzyme S subunit
VNGPEWQPVPLSECITHRKELIRIDDRERYARCRVQLNARGIVLRDRVHGVELKTKDQQVCCVGELLVAEIDAKLGGFGIVPQELNGAVVSSHYFLFRVHEARLRRRFLDYYIRTPAFQEQVRARGSTNYAAIRPHHVLDYTIPLPPLAEQDRIVAKLDAAAARVSEAQRLCHEIDEQRRALVTSLHLSLAGLRDVEMESLLLLDEDRVGVEPEGEYPQVGIRSFGKGLFPKSAVQGVDTTYRVFHRVREGQFILSQVKGWEGAVAVCPPHLSRYFASPEYRTFSTIGGQCLPEYLSAIVSTAWFHGFLADATRGQGARRERTRPELFLKIRLPMPNLEDQGRGADVFRQLDAVMPEVQKSRAELEAMMPAILDRAFKGEL